MVASVASPPLRANAPAPPLSIAVMNGAVSGVLLGCVVRLPAATTRCCERAQGAQPISSKARARALGMGTDLRLSGCGKAVDPSQAMHTPQAIL